MAAAQRRCPAIRWAPQPEPILRCELPVHDKQDTHHNGDVKWTYEPGHFMALSYGHPDWREKVET